MDGDGSPKQIGYGSYRLRLVAAGYMSKGYTRTGRLSCKTQG